MARGGRIGKREFAWISPHVDLTKRYSVGGIANSDLRPRLLVLESEDAGWALYVFDGEGQLLGDTLHKSRSHAVKEGRAIFDVTSSDWKVDVANESTDLRDAVAQIVGASR